MDTILLIVICASFILSASGNYQVPSSPELKLSSAIAKRGLQFNVGIPVPKVSLPDPDYTISHTLDYWPYKKFYTVSMSTVLKKAHKIFWYLYELIGLGLRLAFQVFDIFEMKKSYDALSHEHGSGWGGDGDHEWRKFKRLFTHLSN